MQLQGFASRTSLALTRSPARSSLFNSSKHVALGSGRSGNGVFLSKRHGAIANWLTNKLSYGYKLKGVSARENFKPKGVLVFKARYVRGFRLMLIGSVMLASVFSSVGVYNWLHPMENFPQNSLVIGCAAIALWLFPLFVFPSLGRRTVTRIWLENKWWIHIESHNRWGGLRHVRIPIGFVRVAPKQFPNAMLSALRKHLLGIKVHSERGQIYLRKNGRFIDAPAIKTIFGREIVESLKADGLLKPVALPLQILDDDLFPATTSRFIFDLERNQSLRDPLPSEEPWLARLKFWNTLRHSYQKKQAIKRRKDRMVREGRDPEDVSSSDGSGLSATKSSLKGKWQKSGSSKEEKSQKTVVVGNEVVLVDDLSADDLLRIRTYPIVPPVLEGTALGKKALLRAARSRRAPVSEELDDLTLAPTLRELKVFKYASYDKYADTGVFTPREVSMMREYKQLAFAKVHNFELPLCGKRCLLAASPRVPESKLKDVQWQMIDRRVRWNEENAAKAYCRRQAIADVFGDKMRRRVECWKQGTWIRGDEKVRWIELRFGHKFDDSLFLRNFEEEQKHAYLRRFEELWTEAKVFLETEAETRRGYALSAYALKERETRDVKRLVQLVNERKIKCGWTLEGDSGEFVRIGRKWKKDTRRSWKRYTNNNFRPRRFGRKRWATNWKQRMVFENVKGAQQQWNQHTTHGHKRTTKVTN